ncbi:MAG TPA: hypothetical protein VL989_00905 [Candidatus Sulfotelmatobacter sp.]|nr:hypothetical protein [Candidatus Sulfotelmatobacter sp.]
MGKKKKMYLALAIPIILIVGYLGYSFFRTPEPLKPVYNPALSAPITSMSKLVWPSTGESAVGVYSSPIIDASSPQVQKPTASTGKLITCLVVLQAKPLSPGEQGPLITITPEDVAIYNNYVAQQGSVVKVEVGEQISEYQMLQTILLPSANNMADSLAIWAYGSLANYAVAANNFLAKNNLSDTHVGGDASGFSPETVSTPINMVKLGEMTLSNPVLAGIVGQKSASDIPVVGNIQNVNYLLGQHGIIGIKTGNTDQAGGVYVSASQVNVGGQTYTLVTSNMDSPTLADSINGSIPLITSAQSNISSQTIAATGTNAGYYYVPWENKSVSAVSAESLSTGVWGGSSVSLSASLAQVKAPSSTNKIVGKLSGKGSLGSSSVALVLNGSIPKPGLWWKAIHPFN